MDEMLQVVFPTLGAQSTRPADAALHASPDAIHEPLVSAESGASWLLLAAVLALGTCASVLVWPSWRRPRRHGMQRVCTADDDDDGEADRGGWNQARGLPGRLVGSRVRVVNLSSRPDINGLVGIVTSYSAAQSRYTLSVGGGRVMTRGEREIAIRPANLARL